MDPVDSSARPFFRNGKIRRQLGQYALTAAKDATAPDVAHLARGRIGRTPKGIGHLTVARFRIHQPRRAIRAAANERRTIADKFVQLAHRRLPGDGADWRIGSDRPLAGLKVVAGPGIALRKQYGTIPHTGWQDNLSILHAGVKKDLRRTIVVVISKPQSVRRIHHSDEKAVHIPRVQEGIGDEASTRQHPRAPRQVVVECL